RASARGAREHPLDEELADQVRRAVPFARSVRDRRAAEERARAAPEVRVADARLTLGELRRVQLGAVAALGRDHGAAPHLVVEAGARHRDRIRLAALAVELRIARAAVAVDEVRQRIELVL